MACAPWRWLGQDVLTGNAGDEGHESSFREHPGSGIRFHADGDDGLLALIPCGACRGRPARARGHQSESEQSERLERAHAQLAILADVGVVTLSSFNPSKSLTGSFSDLTLGMVFTAVIFGGFEAAAVLGEESREPRRIIPRGIFGSLALVGAFYLIVSFAEPPR